MLRSIEIVRGLGCPTCIREICVYLGLINFNRKYIDNATESCLPLTWLTEKGQGKKIKVNLDWILGVEEVILNFKSVVTGNTSFEFPSSE